MTQVPAVALAIAFAIAMSSCVSRPQDPEPTPAPVHQYKLTQVQRNGATTFATCADCPRPTPKTVARVERTAAPVALTPNPAVVRPPQKAAPATSRQATATVLFELNSAHITTRVQQQIEALTPLLRQASRIQVTAYTDALGDMALNTRLADARALAIVLAIRERLDGERGAILSGTGRPLCCYVADNKSAATRQPNRRAEVAIALSATAEVETLLQVLSKAPSLRGSLAITPSQAPRAIAATGAGTDISEAPRTESEAQ